MKIIYIANVRLPTEKAHGAQIVKTCEALVQCGHDVELIVPNKATHISDDVFSYYGIRTRFPIHRLSVRKTPYTKIGFLLDAFFFARAARRYLRSASFDVVYGRDEFVLAQISAPYVWESHTGAWNVAARLVARHAKRIVCISEGLKNFYISRGIPAEKIAVAHDGVDLEQFAHPQPKRESRARLGLPREGKIAMYIGRLDGWKGTHTLFEASQLLPDDVSLAVIGGEAGQVAKLAAQYPRVRFLGFHPYRELSDNMAAADVLVLPNTGKDDISVRFTSPLKLFAYMASGIPIVASDLPSIREILSDDSAFLVPPDDASALAAGIRDAHADAGERAARAAERVKEYSWRNRAERIALACRKQA